MPIIQQETLLPLVCPSERPLKNKSLGLRSGKCPAKLLAPGAMEGDGQPLEL